ncbi:hypothetical protein FJR45_00380 [Sulfurimonas sediminis]|uniref:Uncharacterized protein n=1 Tax=Sulfurimonas sediminis TaxID=2590020 RepID=A0A7M1B1F7_9BACT|nr:hypothetical protein [Sulfurimonas sediminis]QOP42492.1 hypothetical protein FJR45_00380 [Sulfurimonas sediminis]
MGKKLKKAYKKLAKYEREKESLLENIKRLQIGLELEKKWLRECRTALQDLKNALLSPSATQWYESRINALEDIIRTGVSTATSYGSMAAQNRDLSKEVRELRLAVYGTIKRKKDMEK